MSFAARLTHTVSILRDHETGSEDAHGQPLTSEQSIATVKAAIQPRSGFVEQEADAISQAGPALSEHVIFMLPTDLTTADVIYHDAAVCPVTSDLPTARFEIVGVPNAAGLGHHLEVVARMVGGALAAAGS